MRIANPPAGAGSSVVVSKIAAPTAFVTLTPGHVSNGTPSAFVADSTRYEFIVSNLDATAVIFARDGAATTDAAGIAVQPKATAVLTTSDAITLTTGSSTAVNYTVNVTRNL